jgi:hypothetical protein
VSAAEDDDVELPAVIRFTGDIDGDGDVNPEF